MAIEFKCPSCGGDLRVPETQKTASCNYCGSSVLVPEEYRTAPPVTGGPVVARNRTAGCLVVIAALIMLLAGGLAVLFLTAVESTPGKLGPLSPSTGSAVLLRFGSEGTGSGAFTDPRHVAVDGEGNIYVAEYGTGRVQVFDSDGDFLRQWFLAGAAGDVSVLSMDATVDGRILASVRGRIGIYDGASGESLGMLSPVLGFEDVFVAGDGSVSATLWSSGDELFRFSPDGDQELHIAGAVQGITGDPELSPLVAVDGLGNSYILGTFNSAVFVYDRDGRYRNSFGSSGQEPGQFTAPSDIAVDGRGLVYVSDFDGIQVFDGTGRFLGLIDPPTQGFPHGIDFTPEGNLAVVSGSCEVLVIPPYGEP